jgi:hypothetical protein
MIAVKSNPKVSIDKKGHGSRGKLLICTHHRQVKWYGEITIKGGHFAVVTEVK